MKILLNISSELNREQNSDDRFQMQDLNSHLNAQCKRGLEKSKLSAIPHSLGLPFSDIGFGLYIHFCAFRNLCTTFVNYPTRRLKTIKNKTTASEKYYTVSCR